MSEFTTEMTGVMIDQKELAERLLAQAKDWTDFNTSESTPMRGTVGLRFLF